MDFPLIPFILFLILLRPLHSSSNLHTIKHRFRSELVSESNPAKNSSPTTYFEVTRPIKLPSAKPYSYLILQHDFAYTYGKSPILSNYTPTKYPSRYFEKIVLEWTAASKGRQFDRIFGVWLGGAEILRSCTAEPRASGIIWTVLKDITRYRSLLLKNQTLAVYLGNLVDSTYTGVYHVNITIHFYPAENQNFDVSGADLIVPISRNLPLKTGLWFEIENSTEFVSKEFRIPRNAYRAVLEVYVSFHEKDEFWFGNPPSDYIETNNLTDVAGNGPFREVVVRLDDMVVGAIWPFTVVYTGGINPLLWRPITGIGSFDLPSYDIEITPFLGNVLDGKSHELGFSVTNALNVWYIDANLHVWLDRKSEKTEGRLLGYNIEMPIFYSTSEYNGLDGTFKIGVSRYISSIGWVKSSHDNITTHSVQEFNFTNWMKLGNNGNLQIVNQIIDFNRTIHTINPSSVVQSFDSFKRFLFYMYSNYVAQGNDTYLSIANVTLGYNEKKRDESKLYVSSLKNLQKGYGYMVVKRNLVSSGYGRTRQVYTYKSPGFCYSRNVSCSNITIMYDKIVDTCKKSRPSLVVYKGCS